MIIMVKCFYLPGSAGKREEESQEDIDFYNQHIAPMLEEMAALSTSKYIYHTMLLLFSG